LENFGTLPAGINVKRGEIIFPRVELEKEETSPLEPKNVEKTAKKVEKKEEAPKGEITIDDFAKVDFRVAKVVACEKVEGADKLLKLQLEVGDEIRQVVSGIAKTYKPEDLVGKYVVVVANLKPVKLRGIESKGMILAASNGELLTLVSPMAEIPSGSEVR